MVSKKLLGAAAVLTLVAAPAFAQSVGSSVTGGARNSSTRVTNDTEINNRTETNVRNDTDISNRTSSESLSFSNSSQRNGNVHLVADQSLDQSISNRAPLNFNGRGSNYRSGDNSVRGSAFAAYSGILNQGWNTGTNANTSAATNIAAQGSTTFTTR